MPPGRQLHRIHRRVRVSTSAGLVSWSLSHVLILEARKAVLLLVLFVFCEALQVCVSKSRRATPLVVLVVDEHGVVTKHKS
jgi:hypothetical protein